MPQTIANRGLKQVENIGVREAKRIMRREVTRYLRSVASGGLSHAPIDLSDLTPLLTRGMVVGHLTGLRRAQIMQIEAGVEPISLASRKQRAKRKKRRGFGEMEEALESLTRHRNVPALGELYARRAAGITKREARKINTRLRRATNLAIREGASTKEAIKILRMELRAIGVDPQGDHRLAQVYRTQSSVAFHRARWQAERSQPELWGWEYVTQRDDRVRDEHAELDGTKLPKNSGFWKTMWPPNGYNCRCQVIPIYDKRKARRKEPPKGATSMVDDDFKFNAGSRLK